MAAWHGVELGDLRIEGERVSMRPFRADDAPAITAAMQDRRMHEFVVLPDPYTLDDARDYAERISRQGRADGTSIEGALVDTVSGRLIGSAGLRLPAGHAAAEIGYLVYPDAQGHGHAADAARLLSDWAFGRELARVQIRAAVRNLASVRSALRAGFRYEGTARAAVDTPAGPADAAVLARLVGDPPGAMLPAFSPLPSDGLADDAVSLRPLRPGDAQSLFEMESDPESLRWAFFCAPVTYADMADFAERSELNWLVGGQASMAIVDRDTDATAGTLTLRLAGPPGVGGIGYTMHPAFRGRGYTARALRLVRDWALRPVVAGGAGFHRLELGAKWDNIASQRAARSGGFAHDGMRLARLRNPDGTISDEIRFVALPD
ncbi:MAG: GNAT family N-acetyltransferase [bacterium]